jgi:glycosyltransferase involved in cell wall biosynthesis
LLFFGRLVRFKNLLALIEAMNLITDVQLTIVGDGPEKFRLQAITEQRGLQGRVAFVNAVHGDDKWRLYSQHDLLVIPSITDISPNAALEARASGLPVLLTRETGLQGALADGIILKDLRTSEQIAASVTEIMGSYDNYSEISAANLPMRGWDQVATEHLNLFSELVRTTT